MSRSDEKTNTALNGVDANAGEQISDETPQWVVLRARDEVFLQAGPFSLEQIMQQIGAGETSYTDYVWRPGFEQWAKIGVLPEFDRRRRDLESQFVALPKVEDVFAQFENTDLAKNIEIQRPIVAAKEARDGDRAPSQTNGIDLVTGATSAIAASAPMIQAKALPMRQKTSVVASVPRNATKPVPRFAKFLFAGVIAGLAFVAMLHLTQKRARERQAVVERASEKPVAKAVSPAMVVESKPAVISPPPAPPMIVEKNEIVGVDLSGEEPNLVLKGSYPIHQPLAISLRANYGEITGRFSFYREVKLVTKPGEAPRVELKDWQLPRGIYQIEAAVGDVKLEEKFFIGKNPDSFAAERERFLRLTAYQQQSERKAIYYTASDLKKISHQLELNFKRFGSDRKKWRIYYGDFQIRFKKATNEIGLYAKIIANSPMKSPANLRKAQGSIRELVYPEKIANLQNVATALNERAKAMNKLVNQGRGLATSAARQLPSQALVGQLETIQNEAAKLTVDSVISLPN